MKWMNGSSPVGRDVKTFMSEELRKTGEMWRRLAGPLAQNIRVHHFYPLFVIVIVKDNDRSRVNLPSPSRCPQAMYGI
jgi:hypothetical protein